VSIWIGDGITVLVSPWLALTVGGLFGILYANAMERRPHRAGDVPSLGDRRRVS